MYFAIIGKNKEISLEELKIINPQNLVEITGILITFDTDSPQLLDTLGGIIKRGKIIDKDDILKESEGKKILGTKEKDLGIKLKKEFSIKRFKIVDRLHTDIDVKKKGIEIIRFHQNFGIVRGYQNIKLYEKIDFGKPARSMKMGMMPAKLTHIMINIGTEKFKKNKPGILNSELTIHDPFAGSGTTGFIANYLGYNFIGSDIDTYHLEINQSRRENQNEKNNKTYTIFEHDITQSIPNKILKGNILIVSEGRLGPMVTDNTKQGDIIKFQNKVLELYKNFIKTISETKNTHNTKAIFTIPYYIGYDNFLEEEIKNLGKNLERKVSSIDEVYSREKQKIGRKILILE